MSWVEGETTITAGGEAPERDTEVGGIAADRLASIVSRIERLEEERKGLADNIKDIMAEAKSCGLEPAIVRQVIARRRKEPAELDEADTLLALYERALEGG